MSKTAIIAESNPLLLEVLSATCSLLGFNVLAETSSLEQAFASTRQYKPDLLVYDLGLSNRSRSGLSDLRELKHQVPGLKILLLGTHDALDSIADQIADFGLDGYWNKFGSRAQLLDALKAHTL